ncbi:MAG: HEAT repeat domain-containing protein [Dictyoglomaceae bacterium]|nr:HEAT repeat domain-containing protein [Dictyoglomaceae bacterium]
MRKAVFLLILMMAFLMLEGTVREGFSQGKEAIVREVVRVVVKQSYEKADQVSLPFFEYVKKILEYADYEVVGEEATSYDATFTIEAIGNPGGTYYIKMGKIEGWHWTYAKIEGTLIFYRHRKTFSKKFSCEEGPYSKIFKEYLSPNDAPFKEAFYKGFLPELFKFIGELKGIYSLFPALKDRDFYVRMGAVKTLGELKDKRTLELLISVLEDRNWNVRLEAVKALGELKDKRAVEPLVSALGDDHWNVRVEAVKSLGELKDKRAVEPLISALKEKDLYIRKIIAEVLHKITGQNFGEDHKKWLDWWQKSKEQSKK